MPPTAKPAYRLIENVSAAVHNVARNFVVIATNAGSHKANKYEIYFVDEYIPAESQRATRPTYCSLLIRNFKKV